MQPLADIKVLDLTWHVAGPYATRLLGDWGADVVKIERPGLGDPARAYGPFPRDEPHPDRSGAFLHLNSNKRGVTANLEHEAGREIVRQLARWADVVVESFSPRVLPSLGLDYPALRQVNPGLIMCSISNFGQWGPHRDWKATEFTVAARAGLTYTSGQPDREPLKAPDHLQEYQAGGMATTAIMGAVLHRASGGGGQHIDVSILEVAADSADRRTTLLTGYAYTGTIGTREPAGSALPVGNVPCADGYAHFVVSPAARWRRFVQMLGRHDLLDDAALGQPGFWNRPEAKDLVDSIMYPWVAERTKRQIFEEGQRHRIAVTPLNTPVDVLADRHLRARGYWVEADHPEAGRLPYAGQSFRKHGDGWRFRRTAPLLGQHNVEVLSGILGLSTSDLAALRRAGAI